jgi:hypothetical protein
MKATQVLKKISVALGLNVSLEQIKLLDGVTILESETFAEGSEVFIVMEEELVALPIGEYELEDGRILIVESEGIISSIGEATAEAETEPTAEPVEEVKQGADRLPKRVVKSNIEEQHFAKDKYEEDEAPTEVAPAEAVAEVESVITEEIVAIINELTPEVVTEGDSSEIASDVVTAITDVLAEMPTEVSAKAFSKNFKYGKNKLSEEEATAIQDVSGALIEAITEVVDSGTPPDVSTEISTEIAQTIVDAVTEIVADEEAALSKSIFRKAKNNANKVKNSKVQQRVAKAKSKINLMKTKSQVSAKKVIKFNPEKKQKHVNKFRVSENKAPSYVDRVFNKLFN